MTGEAGPTITAALQSYRFLPTPPELGRGGDSKPVRR